MSGLEVIVIVSLIINAFCLGLIISMGKDAATQKLLTSQMYSAVTTLTTRIAEQSSYLQKIGSTMSELTNLLDDLVFQINNKINMMGHPGMMYRTMDGKYSAQSLEELIGKIKRDGVEDNYLSEDEINGLRKLFEDEDTDDNMNDDFNPDKGKF